ncbi:aquaporin Z [Chryseobacterium koreense]|uniref:Porin n=1 Tax=Chryseobacterium koreense CCUG 49689 TaxID=1304281 RepID=A0A0J7LU34_9FLAO|nr:aquaporin Z [Chryseobacterium koreense]KMQ72455.1 porin [Chryseobacterium koreense CCUG 49689]MBB5333454.1 aquaporin Z [Chryseobacterium koreense]
MAKKLIAEFFGTFWLVFGGCGAAIFASQIAPSADSGQIGILLLGVALAFGLTVLTMVYAVGHISGGHFNPAVSFGLAAGGRLPWKDLLPYVVSQCVGALAAAACLYLILKGANGGELVQFQGKGGEFASNFYGEAVYFGRSYSMMAAFMAETLLTMFFIIVIMGATDKFANGKFAGIAIGLCLTLIHLICIPITNTSVNPARSLSQAVFVGGEAISQLWLFWVAPILGGVIGGIIYRTLLQRTDEEMTAA